MSPALPRSDPTTDDLKSRVEFAGGTIGAKPNLYCEAIELVCGALPRSDPMTDDLKSRVEFSGGTTVIRVK